MKVLVTGSEGYIGTLLVPMLRASGHMVTRLDSCLFRDCAFSQVETTDEVVVLDIRDATPALLEGHDAIIHLAGLSNDPLSDLIPSLTMDINCKATVDLARMAREAGVARFIFSSTCSVYGYQGDTLITELSPVNPLTIYAESKLQAERELNELATGSFHVVHLRHATAYGLSPMLRFDLVVNNLVAWAHATGRIHLKSDGTAWRPFVHVEDIGRALVAALEAPTNDVAGQVLNIGRTEDNVRINELAAMIASAMPGCRIEYAQGASPDHRSYRVDFSKVKTVLPGFRPVWGLTKGIDQVVSGITRSSLAGLQFEDPRYSRISHLKHRLATGSLSPVLRANGAYG